MLPRNTAGVTRFVICRTLARIRANAFAGRERDNGHVLVTPPAVTLGNRSHLMDRMDLILSLPALRFTRVTP